MEKKDCSCSGVCDLQFCDQENTTTSDQITVPKRTDEIELSDELLVIRKDKEQTCFYQAKLEDLSTEVALCLLEKAVQIMPRTDPADGRSLWLNEGFLCMASGDVSQLGVLPPSALERSLKEVFATLPTCDPGDGGPWLNGGTLMQGSLKNECE